MFSRSTHPSDAELVTLIDGEVPEATRRSLERHLATCAPCAHRRASLQSFSLAVNALTASTGREDGRPDVVVRQRLGRALAADSARDRASNRFRTAGPWWAAAAACLVALAVLTRPWLASHDARPSVIETDALPIASLTPGATTAITAKELCSGLRRTPPITAGLRAQVLRLYQMEQEPPERYELDYLITPELGGATDARNLWPQRYGERRWNARVKDQLEDLLPQLVCSGRLDLATAQREMAKNWVSAYQRHFGTDEPFTRAARLPSSAWLVITPPNRENRPSCVHRSGLPLPFAPQAPQCGV